MAAEAVAVETTLVRLVGLADIACTEELVAVVVQTQELEALVD